MIFRIMGIYVITSTFFYVFLRFFQNPKSRDFLRFFAVFRTFSRTMPIRPWHVPVTARGHYSPDRDTNNQCRSVQGGPLRNCSPRRIS